MIDASSQVIGSACNRPPAKQGYHDRPPHDAVEAGPPVHSVGSRPPRAIFNRRGSR